MRLLYVAITLVFCAGLAAAQTGRTPDTPQDQAKRPAADYPTADQLPPSEAPPRSDDADAVPALASGATSDDRTFSSSRENIIDLSPPKDDLKAHPDSAAAMAKVADEDNAEAAAAEVQEFHQWNPMKALKDVEIGDFYFKRKNYRAAMDRYKEALFYKENDAVATFRLAVCQEQMSDRAGALDLAARAVCRPGAGFHRTARRGNDGQKGNGRPACGAGKTINRTAEGGCPARTYFSERK